MRARRRRGRGSALLNPFPPLVDITIATIMILLLVSALHALQSMRADIYEEIDRRQKTLRASVAKTFPDRWGNALKDYVDGEEQKFTFSDRILFPTSQAVLDPGGIRLLQQFGQILRTHQSDLAAIRVEGHTDERPITYPFRSNWELSVARATAVVHILADPRPGVSLDPKLVTAAGYAEYHPVPGAVGHDERAWRLNRRIEIAIRYSPEAILAQLQEKERDARLAGR